MHTLGVPRLNRSNQRKSNSWVLIFFWLFIFLRFDSLGHFFNLGCAWYLYCPRPLHFWLLTHLSRNLCILCVVSKIISRISISVCLLLLPLCLLNVLIFFFFFFFFRLVCVHASLIFFLFFLFRLWVALCPYAVCVVVSFWPILWFPISFFSVCIFKIYIYIYIYIS
jgi:hypothetical protein